MENMNEVLVDNAKVLEVSRKVNWRDVLPLRKRASASFRTAAQVASLTGLYNKYVLDFGPNISKTVSNAVTVVAITQQIAHVGAILEINAVCKVHWIIPEKMIDVAYYTYMPPASRKRISIHIRSIFDPLPQALRGVSIDFLIVDSNHANRQFHAALMSCPSASEAMARRPKAVYVYGRIPLPDEGNVLSAVWNTYMGAIGDGSEKVFVKPATARPYEFNWSVSFEKPSLTSTASKALSSMFTRTMIDFFPGPPAKIGVRLARYISAAIATETKVMKQLVKGRSKMPRCRWDIDYTAYRNRDRPWTPAIHCSKAAMINDITEFVKGFDYVLDGRDSGPSTHAGQLKLLVSEAEFLFYLRTTGFIATTSSPGQAPKPVVVVYVGASPGTHLKYLVGEFGEVSKWILYDSAASDARSLPRVDFRRRYFDDDEVPVVKKDVKGCVVVYISDIRTTTDEKDVRENMIAQARWGVNIGADAMLLKFRLPYVDADGNNETLAESKSDFYVTGVPRPRLTTNSASGFPTWAARRSVFPLGSEGLDVENNDCPSIQCFDECRSKVGVLYLDGSVVTQVFAPPTSTESRLVVFKSVTGAYNLTRWDPRKYESCMNGYNEDLRRVPDASIWFPELGVPTTIGMDDTYECCRARSSLAKIGVDLGREFGEALIRKVRSSIAKPPKMNREEREMHGMWEESQRTTVSDHERVMALRASAASSSISGIGVTGRPRGP